MTFAQAALKYLQSVPVTPDNQKLIDVLSEPNLPRHAVHIAMYETHVRTKLGKTLTLNDGFDWSDSSIDWQTVIAFIIQIMLILLPLLLPLL